jgi:hypothetical protein
MGIETLTAVVMKNFVLWDQTPHSLLKHITKLNLGSTAILLGLGLLFSFPNPIRSR